MPIKPNTDSNEKNVVPLWINEDNISYYEAVPVKTLAKYATLGGFENGCDIDVVFEQIRGSASILEIGAGTGRVLRNLRERGYSGKLYGIERSTNMYNHLIETYSDSAHIILGDIRHFEPTIKFNTIMWMFTGISDFSKKEQLPILQRISGWLDDDGVLVIDTISHTTTLAAEFTFKDQHYVERATHGTVYGYVPTSEEMAEYAKTLGFKSEHFPYETMTSRPRIIHVFKKR